MYGGNAKLDKKTLEILNKRWSTTKFIYIFLDDESVFERHFGFIDAGWSVQQALIMLESFERNNQPFIHTKHELRTTGIHINGRLYDALRLKAELYHCEFEPFVLSLVHAYANHLDNLGG